jgi:hypothetical protein
MAYDLKKSYLKIHGKSKFQIRGSSIWQDFFLLLENFAKQEITIRLFNSIFSGNAKTVLQEKFAIKKGKSDTNWRKNFLANSLPSA